MIILNIIKEERAVNEEDIFYIIVQIASHGMLIFTLYYGGKMVRF